MRNHRIAAACALLLAPVCPSIAQVIGSGHVIGNGTTSPAAPTDTPLINILTLPGSGFRAARVITSGATDTLSGSDQTVMWDSATASAKAETVPACSSSNAAWIYTVVDEEGTAGLLNITLTPVSGTIGGAASQSILLMNGAMTIQCDGVSNWSLQ